jgi:hypothetical protein
MNADAAGVPNGKFVMIATTDKTSVENARLYARNGNPAGSSMPFTFLSDLDQASSSAWADWLNNMKPAINERISTADSDHERADVDHSMSSQDHTTALADYQTLTDASSAANSAAANANEKAEYALTQGDYAKNMADHPAYIADGTLQYPGDTGYFYTWDYASRQYQRRSKLSLDWETMSEEQKKVLAADVLAQITFASVETCENIIIELK